MSDFEDDENSSPRDDGHFEDEGEDDVYGMYQISPARGSARGHDNAEDDAGDVDGEDEDGEVSPVPSLNLRRGSNDTYNRPHLLFTPGNRAGFDDEDGDVPGRGEENTPASGRGSAKAKAKSSQRGKKRERPAAGRGSTPSQAAPASRTAGSRRGMTPSQAGTAGDGSQLQLSANRASQSRRGETPMSVASLRGGAASRRGGEGSRRGAGARSVRAGASPFHTPSLSGDTMFGTPASQAAGRLDLNESVASQASSLHARRLNFSEDGSPLASERSFLETPVTQPHASSQSRTSNVRSSFNTRASGTGAGDGDLSDIAEGDESDLEDIDDIEMQPDEELSDEMKNKIKRKLRKFFETFKEEEEQGEERETKLPYYIEKLQEMGRENSRTLVVIFRHIWDALPAFAFWIFQAPDKVLGLLDAVALEICQERYPTFGQMNELSGIRVSLAEFPASEQMTKLKAGDLRKLIRIHGIISKRSIVYNEVSQWYLDCDRCGFTMGPIQPNADADINPKCCADCQGRGPFKVNVDKTRYRNFQRVTIQERPSATLAGRPPQSKECILTDEQVDTVRPGDDVSITGVYICLYDSVVNAQSHFPVFRTQIKVNYIEKTSGEKATSFTAEEKEQILALAAETDIRERVIASIAPSIFGEHLVKTGLAMAMFGGQMKTAQGSHRIRGDLNMLILGDPGMAKSQLLKYVERTFYRAVYTTGKGASAVGLTAGVVRDNTTGEWTLEGGAMVLADSGICLIDEFDKMNDQDRTSIHEAMEQQSISISKAGIVATLQARCSVIAAANPVKGVYDPMSDFLENVNLTDPILSRFDILCVLKSEVDKIHDDKLADFVICAHMRGHPDLTDEEVQRIVPRNAMEFRGFHNEPLSQDLLKKYILYARQNVFPTLGNLEKEKLAQFYTEIRAATQGRGGMSMTVRHIEAMIRMAEANARMELRNTVTSKDVDHAMATMLECFCQTQKHQLAEELRTKFRHFIEKVVDTKDLCYMQLVRLFREEDLSRRLERNPVEGQDELPLEVSVADFARAASSILGVSNPKRFLKTTKFLNSFRVVGNKIQKKEL